MDGGNWLTAVGNLLLAGGVFEEATLNVYSYVVDLITCTLVSCDEIFNSLVTSYSYPLLSNNRCSM